MHSVGFLTKQNRNAEYFYVHFRGNLRVTGEKMEWESTKIQLKEYARVKKDTDENVH